MRILMLHLSDIHVRTAGDAVLSRARFIADGAAQLEAEIDLCLIALTGDVAFSGKAVEYESARKWLVALRVALEDALGRNVPVRTAMVAGNHDCDFSEPSTARSALIDSMAKDPRIASDPSSVMLCIQPQKSFFEFRDGIASEGLFGDTRVYYEYRFTVGEESILLRCCNTAWVSQLQENPAKLVFPENAITEVQTDTPNDSLVVTLMHHTYNWLVPSKIRPVRRRIQAVSDFILTGHEHAFGLSQLQDESGGTAVYVEGVALQEQGASLSGGFNAIIIDTKKSQFRVVQFEWSRGRYRELGNGPYASWVTYSTNPLRSRHLFRLSPQMQRFLSDPGLSLTHPQRGALSLDDVFIYLDVREVLPASKSRRQPTTRSAGDLLELSASRGRLLVTGAQESGKSTLAKRLFADALDAGLVPLLLDGRTVRLRGDEKDRKELTGLFEDQYSATAEEYLDLPRDQRVLIVDDVSALKPAGQGPRAALRYLSQFAGRLIVFSNHLEHVVQELFGVVPSEDGPDGFLHYSILPVGHVRREDLIDRYVVLSDLEDAGRAEELRADMRRILATAIGKYLAPPNPVSIISILQARAFNEQLNLQHSTYGYYHELLIKRQLLGAAKVLQEIDVLLAYLTSLADNVFERGERNWDEGWMMSFHQSFTKERKISLQFGSVVRVLLERGILVQNGGAFAFKHDYIFYYFCGRTLADGLATEAGRARVAELTQHLAAQDVANILLFVTHHSKHPAIIDPMLRQAELLFKDAPRAELKADQARLPELEAALRGAAYEDRPIVEQRKRYLSRLDDAEPADEEGKQAPVSGTSVPEISRRQIHEETIKKVVAFVTEMSLSLRTMQILGQLLRNFPGTLSGDQKDRITRAIYGVSMRTLGFIHQLLKSHTEDFVVDMVNSLRRAHPDMASDELVQAARSSIYWLLHSSAYSMIQRTSADVAMPILDPVFEEIERLDPVPAIKLISLAIRLERSGSFPEQLVRDSHGEFERNPVAKGVLRSLVIRHFHLFDVSQEIKQSTCALLGIEYKPLLPRARTRLLLRSREP